MLLTAMRTSGPESSGRSWGKGSTHLAGMGEQQKFGQLATGWQALGIHEHHHTTLPTVCCSVLLNAEQLGCALSCHNSCNSSSSSSSWEFITQGTAELVWGKCRSCHDHRHPADSCSSGGIAHGCVSAMGVSTQQC